MLSESDNQTRNLVMQKIKFEQMKRSKLREFMRKAKDDILDKREKDDDEDEDIRNESLEQKQKRQNEERQMAVNDYKKDYLKYFESKVKK